MTSVDNTLVTGAGGFIGRRLCVRLQHASSARLYRLFHCTRPREDSDAVDIQADLTDRDDLQRIAGIHFSTVVHCAGLAHRLRNDDETEQRMSAVNFEGTVNLCRALEAAPPKQLIFLSSVAVYGRDEGLDIGTDCPTRPVTAYGASKLRAEDYLRRWASAHSVRLCILRPCLVYHPDAPGNLAAMRRGLESGRYLSIGGGRGALKSTVDLDELVDRIIDCIDRRCEGIYNVAGRQPMGFREIEARMCAELGLERPHSIPLWLARCLARIGDVVPQLPINTPRLSKIVKPLTFSSELNAERL